MRAIIFLLASTLGSVAFQMSVDAGYIRRFTWAVPWVWGACAALWVAWLLSHDWVKTVWLKTFHKKVGEGIVLIRIALCGLVFLGVGLGLKILLSPTTTETNTSRPQPATQPELPKADEGKPDASPPESAPAVRPIPAGRPLKRSAISETGLSAKQAEIHPVAPKQSSPPTSGISQNNSGGINVQQATTGSDSPIVNSPITIGSVPKRISPQDIDTIRNYLASATNKARIVVAVDQYSSPTFAEDLYRVFKEAGWPMEHEGVDTVMLFSAPGKRFQGAEVIMKGEPVKPNETVQFSNGEPITYVGKVLEALKVPRSLRRDPKVADDLITIQLEGGLPD